MRRFSPPSGERLDNQVALDRVLRASSLTSGGKPFHAILDIGLPAEPYSGRIEVWWVGAQKYRLSITAPRFKQLKIVNGGQVQEKDEGDYYPRWLQDFALAILNPGTMLSNFRDAIVAGSHIQGCLRRDDRPGGITDQLTWGIVCFTGSEPLLASVLTMNHSMEFKDWKNFGKKQIARTYETDVLDYQPVVGRLITLEELKRPDEALFAVTAPTPPDQQIATTFVSTLKEESLIDNAPTITWPPVREGKTEGYMIVYARTDRTGQVRETAKHNSDQPGLEQFGMEQALRYKFKPLIVDGVPQQMEMPLVLHFTSHIEDPLPILSVEDMKKQMRGCSIPDPTGTTVRLKVSVNEEGKVTGLGPVGDVAGTGWMGAVGLIENCHFAPYIVNGRPTYYHGYVEVRATQ